MSRCMRRNKAVVRCNLSSRVKFSSAFFPFFPFPPPPDPPCAAGTGSRSFRTVPRSSKARDSSLRRSLSRLRFRSVRSDSSGSIVMLALCWSSSWCNSGMLFMTRALVPFINCMVCDGFGAPLVVAPTKRFSVLVAFSILPWEQSCVRAWPACRFSFVHHSSMLARALLEESSRSSPNRHQPEPCPSTSNVTKRPRFGTDQPSDATYIALGHISLVFLATWIALLCGHAGGVVR
jgi:hypothetical protein